MGTAFRDGLLFDICTTVMPEGSNTNPTVLQPSMLQPLRSEPSESSSSAAKGDHISARWGTAPPLHPGPFETSHYRAQNYCQIKLLS